VNGDELGGILFLLGCGGLLLLAIRICGIRRVLWVIAVVVFTAFLVAIRSLSAITGGRRY
jgi:hypothetical protein